MKIELYIDGENKVFTTPFVPMLAKRKYLEIEAKAQERESPITAQEQLNEDDEMVSILVDIIFKNQFTLMQVYEGASKEYIDEKMLEAIWGITPKSELKSKENNEGNDQGE
ncbi:phage tail assembly chaperone G [Alkalihalobacterium alkalinitrilicum]|uniref:phage tail assembly chaperone G n=1 Tax=Alkalihalobacterium alkalinitrilicum TaxID=427920 RepID=UPI000995CCB5|nr:hypothetical protein [Alkalihalobacterium alkalinitrilicum]